MSSVNTMTRASPGSENTLITLSRLSAMPVNGLNRLRSVCPIQMPAASDGITCLLQIASRIASTGGRTEYQAGSLIAALGWQPVKPVSRNQAFAIVAKVGRRERLFNHSGTASRRRAPGD